MPSQRVYWLAVKPEKREGLCSAEGFATCANLETIGTAPWTIGENGFAECEEACFLEFLLVVTDNGRS